MRRFVIFAMAVAMGGGIAFAETKFASDATAAVGVVFGAKDAGWRVKALAAKTGTEDKTVDVYARKQQALSIQDISAYSAQTCTVVNTGTVIASGDKVIYQHADGSAEYFTVSSSDATTVVLSAAITGSYASGDKLYEIGQIGSFDIGATNATTAKASMTEAGAALVQTPSDSPLYIENSGSTNNLITATAE